jgi:hypothetical protein
VPRQTGLLTNHVDLLSSFADPEDPDLSSALVIEAVDHPPLKITADGSRVVLAWPAIASDYFLEVSDALVPTTWLVDGNPQVIVGDTITVTVKVTHAQRYYRLKQP